MTTANKTCKSLFLLGGHDLEMLTIKEILNCNNIPFCDKNLK